MKTILVPTDYSASAKNAALYAINLATQLKVERIILYNAYQMPPVITENAVMPNATTPFFDVETLRDISNTAMHKFYESIVGSRTNQVRIEQMTEFATLENDLDELCRKTGAHLIVMGITGASKIEEVLIGSTAISVVKNTRVPVIIVPSEASPVTIRKVMFACDLKRVVETTPINPIKFILETTKAELHIVNIYKNEKDISSTKTYEQELLNSLLKEYKPQFHFEDSADFIACFNHFIKENNIDLVIAIPKKHSFFENLFKEGHLKRIAFNSPVAIMCIHEEDV